ncbi:MAG: LysR family transcriptional regulator [Deltaproteobacteria bacterium]|nr:LysR family transcriptional regulator [Deltaproteobacteria bacterium]
MRRMKCHEISLKIKAWVECRGFALIGSGRGALLDAIEEHGSISAAAKSLGLSYATAWHRLDSMNKAMGAPLVEPRSGGKGGGGTNLTERGRAVIKAFGFMQERIEEFRMETEKGIKAIIADRNDQHE